MAQISPVQWQAVGAAVGPDNENHVVQVTVVGDDIKVICDGKPVPAGSIRRDGDRVSVLDEHGDVMYEIALRADEPAGTWEMETVSLAQPAEQPPVMVGITMTEPDDALRAHLGLGNRKVIMLGDVIEGLPAARAGLKKYDIIVAIDGRDDNVTPEQLGEVLKDKKPGDELKLLVLRGGKKETYTLKLQAYDAEAFGRRQSSLPGPTALVVPPQPTTPSTPRPGLAKDRLEQVIGQLRSYGLSEQQLDSVRKALRRTLEEVEEVEILRGPQGAFIFQGPDGQKRMFQFAPRPWELSEPDREKLEKKFDEFIPLDREELEERLTRLERRLDEMTGQLDERLERVLKRVEELTDRLERRLRDGG
ncbi:MAG: hypothetical protein Kow0022_15620 [Phycisphaerales bacterium]